MASTTDVVATLPETGNPSDTAAPGEKVDDVHEETPEVEEPKMTPSTTLALLQAEMGSVVKSMSDLRSRSRRKIRSLRMSKDLVKWMLPRSNWMFWSIFNMT